MGKLKLAPVYFAVAQVQFNPIEEMGNYLNNVQPAFRRLGFPDFKTQAFQRVILPFNNMDSGNAVPPSIASQSRYSFGNIDGTETFILETNSLGFQTTSYDVFKTFSENFLKGIMILHSAIELSFVERIGIRYLDAVQPTANETLADYLSSEVLGLSTKLSGTPAHSESVTVMNDDAGQLVSRVIITNGKIGFPMDIAPTAPKINLRFTEAEGIHAILDTDSSYAQRFPFSNEMLAKRLDALKSKITQSFDATVTPHAKKVWDQL
jgi:uncharacterized protein (TIGR04255 family)